MTQLKIAVIPGDGIGTEVIAEALKVARAAVPAWTPLNTTSAGIGTSIRARSCRIWCSTS